MEGLDQKLERVSGDVNALIELYDFAEKLHPYSETRGPAQVSYIHFDDLSNSNWN